MSGDPDNCDTEELRKKVEVTATFPDDSGTKFDRDFILAWLSEKNEMRLKGNPYARIHCAAR